MIACQATICFFTVEFLVKPCSFLRKTLHPPRHTTSFMKTGFVRVSAGWRVVGTHA